MTPFTDRYQRVIDIEVDFCDAFARHDGRTIGSVRTTGSEFVDDYTNETAAEITGMHVDEGYREAGIGTELLRQLSDELGALAPAQKNTGIGGLNALTDDGLALTRKGQKLGYILPFPDEQEHLD